MTDYPYPASFLEPMPAWPVAESVKPFINIPTLDEIAKPTLIETATEKLISMSASISNFLSNRPNQIN